MPVDEEYLQKLMRTVSHDMGGTLRTAVGFSKLLLESYGEALDEKATKWLSLIKEDSEKMQEKLIALSRYARLYDITDNPVECDLNELCKTAIDVSGVGDLYPDVGVTVERLPVVKGYERLWVDYFAEIIGNVAKHSGMENSIRCRIYCHTEGEHFVVSVADYGVGLTDKQKEMAILPYRTITGRGPVGIGMGLPMAKRIAELQGGYLLLEDNPLDETGLQVSLVLEPEQVLRAAGGAPS